MIQHLRDAYDVYPWQSSERSLSLRGREIVPLQSGVFFFLANDLAIANNRYVSSCHCVFEFDNGHLYLSDNSSNGTLINRSTKISRNESVSKDPSSRVIRLIFSIIQRVELQTGDIVHLVFRKDAPEASTFVLQAFTRLDVLVYFRCCLSSGHSYFHSTSTAKYQWHLSFRWR